MTFLSWMSSLYTVVLFVALFVEFATDGRVRLNHTLTNGLYLALLSAYVGTME